MSDWTMRWDAFNQEVPSAKPPFRPRLDRAIRLLNIQIAKLEATHHRLLERDRSLFRRVVSSIQMRDTVHASIFANELAQVRRTSKAVIVSRLAFEQIVARMSTMKELGDLASQLAPTVTVIKNAQLGISSVLPEAEKEMGEIGGLLGDILVDANQLGTVSARVEPLSLDAEKVLSEANMAAEKEMSLNLPELPKGLLSGNGGNLDESLI